MSDAQPTELTPEQLRTCPRCHKPINPESGEACSADVKCIFAQRDHYWACTQRLEKIAASLTSEQRERAEHAEGKLAEAKRDAGRMHYLGNVIRARSQVEQDELTRLMRKYPPEREPGSPLEYEDVAKTLYQDREHWRERAVAAEAARDGSQAALVVALREKREVEERLGTALHDVRVLEQSWTADRGARDEMCRQRDEVRRQLASERAGREHLEKGSRLLQIIEYAHIRDPELREKCWEWLRELRNGSTPAPPSEAAASPATLAADCEFCGAINGDPCDPAVSHVPPQATVCALKEAQGGKVETCSHISTDYRGTCFKCGHRNYAVEQMRDAEDRVETLEAQLRTQAAEREALLSIIARHSSELMALPAIAPFLKEASERAVALRSQPTPTAEEWRCPKCNDTLAGTGCLSCVYKRQPTPTEEACKPQEACKDDMWCEVHNRRPSPVATAAEGERVIDLCPHCEKPLHFGSCEPPPASPPASDAERCERTVHSFKGMVRCLLAAGHPGFHSYDPPARDADGEQVYTREELGLDRPGRVIPELVELLRNRPPLPVELGPVDALREEIVAALRNAIGNHRARADSGCRTAEIILEHVSDELARKTGGAR